MKLGLITNPVKPCCSCIQVPARILWLAFVIQQSAESLKLLGDVAALLFRQTVIKKDRSQVNR